MCLKLGELGGIFLKKYCIQSVINIQDSFFKIPYPVFGFIVRSIYVQCTEVRFSSFLSSEFTTMAVINQPEKKLAKRTSVQWLIKSGYKQKVLKVYSSINNFLLMSATSSS